MCAWEIDADGQLQLQQWSCSSHGMGPSVLMSHVSLVCALDAARPECGKLEFIKVSPYEDVSGLLNGADTLTTVSVKHLLKSAPPPFFFFFFFNLGVSWT